MSKSSPAAARTGRRSVKASATLVFDVPRVTGHFEI